jgi:hydrogenase expression/formation protein HypC
MCLAFPGKILKIDGKVALVDFGGVRRDVRLDLLDRVHEGDYVIVHVGYAIQVLDQKEAERMLKSWAEVLEGVPNA